MRRSAESSPLLYVARLASPDIYKLSVVLILMSASLLLSFAFPLAMRYLIDVALARRDSAEVARVIVMLGAAYLTQVGMSYVANYLYVRAANEFVLRLRRSLFERILALRYEVAGGTGTGDLIARVMEDVGRIQTFYMSTSLRLITSVLSIVIALVLLIRMNVSLTVVASAAVPLQFLLYQVVARKAQALSRRVQHQVGKVTSWIAESIRGLMEIKVLTAERFARDRFRRLLAEHGNLKVTLHLVSCAASHGGTLLTSLAPLVVIWFGSLLIARGEFTIGTLVAFTTTVARLYSPIDGLAGLNLDLRIMVGAAERVMDLRENLLCEPDEPVFPRDQDQYALKWGDVQFDHVWFRYRDNTPFILRNLSFRIGQGEHIALVGDNGTGKTTVARLILGLLEPTQGEVLIGGQSVSQVPRDLLRRKITYISGEPYVFNATLRENLLIAKPDATDDELLDVLEAMNIEIGNGLCLDTVLAEGGVRLSAGQRQRISLARALLRAPEVLILDEATSSLDAPFERHLLRVIADRFRGKTVVFIAHRESTLEGAVRRVELSCCGEAEMDSARD